MKNSSEFVVEISSDLDYEEIVANVLFDEETIAVLSQEKGLDNLEIEIMSSTEAASRKFSFTDFFDALQLARKRLIEMQKLSDE